MPNYKNKDNNDNRNQGIQIRPSDLKEKMDKAEDLFILDVRTPQEHESLKLSYNRYEDSLLVPIDALASFPDILGKEHQIPKDKQIITLCSHGIRSMMAAKYLTQLGYNARSIEGGLSAWNNVYDVASIPLGDANLSSKIKIWQLRRVSKGCIGYLVASEVDKIAIAIDATCDINEVVAQIADANNLHITKIIDTHLHADHISGASLLAKIYGAEVYLSSFEGYEIDENDNDDNGGNAGIIFKQLRDNERINISKGISLVSLYTPGHTSGSMCLKLDIDYEDNYSINYGLKKHNNSDYNKTDDNAIYSRNSDNNNNIATTSSTTRAKSSILFAGDTLFVNGIGRPDLQNKAHESTYNLYSTYQQKILNLPKETLVLPGHFNDSFEHQKPIFDTLGSIRNKVKVLSLSKDEFFMFVQKSLDNLQQPLNYRKIIDINKKMLSCDKVKIPDLEYGPNSCGIRS